MHLLESLPDMGHDTALPRLVRRARSSRREWVDVCRNRSARTAVIRGVGKKKGVAAALLAAGLVLSGCGVGEGEGPTTTSSALSEALGNPWEVPLEQRPELFDPCSPAMVAAVEEGVGTPLTPDEDFTVTRPTELRGCGWTNDEVRVSILSTWKSRDQYLADSGLQLRDPAYFAGDRSAMLMTDSALNSESPCRALYFTERGTVLMSLSFRSGLRTFQGEHFVDACDGLGQVIQPVARQIPEGDFR